MQVERKASNPSIVPGQSNSSPSTESLPRPSQRPIQPSSTNLRNRTKPLIQQSKEELLTHISTLSFPLDYDQIETKVTNYLFAGQSYSNLYSNVKRQLDSAFNGHPLSFLQSIVILSIIDQYKNGAYKDHPPTIWQRISDLFANIIGFVLDYGTKASTISKFHFYLGNTPTLFSSFLKAFKESTDDPKLQKSILDFSRSSLRLEALSREHQAVLTTYQSNPKTAALFWCSDSSLLNLREMKPDQIANLALYFLNQNDSQECLRILTEAKEKSSSIEEIFTHFFEELPKDQYRTWITQLNNIDSYWTKSALEDFAKKSQGDLSKLASLWIASFAHFPFSDLKTETIAKLAYHLIQNEQDPTHAFLLLAKEKCYASNLKEVFAHLLKLVPKEQKATWIETLKQIETNATVEAVSEQAKNLDIPGLVKLWSSSKTSIQLKSLNKETVAKLAHYYLSKEQKDNCIAVLKKAKQNCHEFHLPGIFSHFLSLLPSTEWASWIAILKTIDSSQTEKTLKQLAMDHNKDISILSALYLQYPQSIDFSLLNFQTSADLALQFFPDSHWLSILTAIRPKNLKFSTTAFLEKLSEEQLKKALPALLASIELQSKFLAGVQQFASTNSKNTKKLALIYTASNFRIDLSRLFPLDLAPLATHFFQLSSLPPLNLEPLATHFFQSNQINHCKAVLQTNFSDSSNRKLLFDLFLEKIDISKLQKAYSILFQIDQQQANQALSEVKTKLEVNGFKTHEELMALWPLYPNQLNLHVTNTQVIATAVHQFWVNNPNQPTSGNLLSLSFAQLGWRKHGDILYNLLLLLQPNQRQPWINTWLSCKNEIRYSASKAIEKLASYLFKTNQLELCSSFLLEGKEVYSLDIRKKAFIYFLSNVPKESWLSAVKLLETVDKNLTITTIQFLAQAAATKERKELVLFHAEFFNQDSYKIYLSSSLRQQAEDKLKQENQNGIEGVD